MIGQRLTPRELLSRANGFLTQIDRLRLGTADIAMLDSAIRDIEAARDSLGAHYQPIEVRQRCVDRW